MEEGIQVNAKKKRRASGSSGGMRQCTAGETIQARGEVQVPMILEAREQKISLLHQAQQKKDQEPMLHQELRIWGLLIQEEKRSQATARIPL